MSYRFMTAHETEYEVAGEVSSLGGVTKWLLCMAEP